MVDCLPSARTCSLFLLSRPKSYSGHLVNWDREPTTGNRVVIPRSASPTINGGEPVLVNSCY